MPSFFTAYVTAALFTSIDDKGEPLDKRRTPADIDPDTIARMKADCELFQSRNLLELSGLDEADAGKDFWFTRNHHGSGFWDGGYEEPQATRLTDAAHNFGEYTLFVGDDGAIYGAHG